MNVFQPDDDGGAADVGEVPGVVVPAAVPGVVPGEVPAAVPDDEPDGESDGGVPRVSGGVPADVAGPDVVPGVAAPDVRGGAGAPQPASSTDASVSAANMGTGNAAVDAAHRRLMRVAISPAAPTAPPGAAR
ncbi:hypothetical protein [Arthrobacter sp. NicSoilB8]|uniref:hypothetical protein n=1 Tax=Arthrobacter sp. NicSoilB8 TaxID=2830998 RepID=UPI001CC687C5|nr:hypothetical protein [Arthrobacter sp. NicSoilB8]